MRNNMGTKREFFSVVHKIQNYKKVCKLEAKYFQHGKTTVLTHSRNVAFSAFKFSKFLERKLSIHFNYENLIVGAFLHDFFIYDWHEKDKSHRLHGFRHPKIASNNAKEICKVNKEVQKIIETHMWPLTITKIPKSREALVLCLVDKIVATRETFCGH